MTGAKRQPLILAAILFVLSGAAGLAYEVIWFKRFTHVWGSSAHAWASVVAAYLLGLGIGAGVAGRRADRAARPLRLYGLCELGIAACALAVPMAIHALFDATAGIYTALGIRRSRSGSCAS
jgi:spermidine synthase